MNATPPPVIAIVDDHRLLSASLTAALEADGFRVVAPPLTDMGEVAAALAEERPSVALLDLNLGPFGSGEDLLPALRELEARVLVVSGVEDEAAVGRCLVAGAWGWVPKSSSFEALLDAILKSVAGEAVLTPAERDRLVGAWRQRQSAVSRARAPFESLTRRESAVLAMLMEGKPAERIATDSYVSVATVRTQVRAILVKLGVNSQLEAVAMANRSGWVAPGGKRRPLGHGAD